MINCSFCFKKVKQVFDSPYDNCPVENLCKDCYDKHIENYENQNNPMKTMIKSMEQGTTHVKIVGTNKCGLF